MTATVRVVGDDQWSIVAWLWQDFRHDLAPVVRGFPYADGRYRHEWLEEYPAADRVGYLAWAPHPRTGDNAPIGFALVRGLDDAARTMQAFFVVPAARRAGTGRWFAAEVIARHAGPWHIPFQHDNAAAGPFWRAVAGQQWAAAWTETQEPIEGRPELPGDHWIRTLP